MVVGGKLHLRKNYATRLNKKGMLSKGSGMNEMPTLGPLSLPAGRPVAKLEGAKHPSRLPNSPLKNPGYSSATVILLDMTWHAPEYWIQAKSDLRQLYPTLGGKVFLAPIGKAKKTAVIKNKETFFTRTLPMLNSRAMNPGKSIISMLQGLYEVFQ